MIFFLITICLTRIILIFGAQFSGLEQTTSYSILFYSLRLSLHFVSLSFNLCFSTIYLVLYYYSHIVLSNYYVPALYYYFCYLKYLLLNAGQLRGTHRPKGALTQTFKQPYEECFLTRHKFSGVQWGKLNNMKRMSRNISGPFGLAYPNICVAF